MTGSGTAPSKASLVLLFADQIVPAKTAVTRGVQVPGKEAKVQMAALARLLMACSLWSMREQGVVSVDLRQEERKGLLRKKTISAVHVEPTGKQAVGVERTVHALIPDQGATALAVTKKLVARSSAIPAADVIKWFTKLAEIEGLVAVDEGFMKDKVHPVPERVAGLEPAFAELRNAWTTFQGREPDLCNALLDECKRGIDSMTSST